MISDIHEFITDLHYDPRRILARKDGDEVLSPDPKKTKKDADSVVVCTYEKASASGELSENVIMGPSSSASWPGALLRADDEFVRGNIETIQVPRGPMTRSCLYIDLPGMEDYNMPDIGNPSQPTVQGAVRRAVDWWLENKYPEGYRNYVRLSSSTSVAHSSEQLAIELGINLKSVSTSVASQLKVNTTSDRKVSVMLFRQVYYSAYFQPPSDLAGVFDPSIDIETLKHYISEDTPPVYVSRVDYGRMILFRLETHATTTDADAKFALEYAFGTAAATGANAETRYQKIIEDSSISVISIGGNAEATMKSIDAKNTEEIRAVATDPRHVELTKANPALPIAYVTNFLKDNALARIGVTTDYVQRKCVRYENGFVKFVHKGAYVAQFKASWSEDGKQKSWESGNITIGYSHTLHLPGNAKHVLVRAYAITGLVWQQMGEVFSFLLPGPTNRTYTTCGTTLGRWYAID